MARSTARVRRDYRTRTNRFTPEQDAVLDTYLTDKNRSYAWLLDTAIRKQLAEDGVEFPEKYGVRRAVAA